MAAESTRQDDIQPAAQLADADLSIAIVEPVWAHEFTFDMLVLFLKTIRSSPQSPFCATVEHALMQDLLVLLKVTHNVGKHTTETSATILG